MPDKDNFGAVLQPVGYRWQNDRDGLVEDGTAPACRASAGSSGFHEMNHPVVLARDNAAHAAVAFDWQKGNDVNNPRPSTMNVAVEHSQTIGTTRTPAVAFTPGNLARGAGPSPNAEVAPTQRCSAGRGADDQRTCVAFHPTQDPISSSDSFHALGTGSKGGCATAAVAFTRCDNGRDASVEVTPTMRCGSNYSAHPAVAQAMTVRRLTPKEAERLQAFPDDYTLIPWRKKPATECPDGPRYKALGNSMAVNCMAWIGERIAAVESNFEAALASPLPPTPGTGGAA